MAERCVTHDSLVQTEVGYSFQVEHGQVTLANRGHRLWQPQVRVEVAEMFLLPSCGVERVSDWTNLEPFSGSNVPEISSIPADKQQTASGTETCTDEQKASCRD